MYKVRTLYDLMWGGGGGGGGGGAGGGVVTEDFVSHRDFVVSDKFVILRSTHWL